MAPFDTFYNQTVYYKSSEDMSEIRSNSIGVIVTSPPYNLKKTYSDDDGRQYDDAQPLDDYFAFLTRVWKECFRVCSSSGVFFLNIGDSASTQGLSEQVVQLAVNAGFTRIQTIIWLKSFLGKGHYTPTGGEKRLNNIWENIYVLVKDSRQYKLNPKAIGIPYADKSNIGRYSDEDLRDAGNTWLTPYSKTTGATVKKGHDAPFPLELPIKCIKLAGGDTVLDPFLGSGTTLAAAEILGKKGYGYEKYPRKKLIAEKIQNSSHTPTPVILLPHLESSLRLLTQLTNTISPQELDQKGFFKFSRKEQLEMQILESVFQQLGLTLPLLDYYKHILSLKGLQTPRALLQFFDHD